MSLSVQDVGIVANSVNENDEKPDDRIAAQFATFHAENPWVYRRLRELALAVRRAGVYQYGIGGLYETLRYEVFLDARDADGFKARIVAGKKKWKCGVCSAKANPSGIARKS